MRSGRRSSARWNYSGLDEGMKRLRVGPHWRRGAGPNAVLRVVNECSVDPTWHARIALMTWMASEEKCFVP